MNWSGKRRWIALLLLLAGVFVMLTTPPIIPVIQLPGEVYPDGWHLFGLIGPLPSITNTLMGSILVWLLLMLLMWYVHRKRPQTGGETPPGGFYNFFEMLFEGLYNFVAGIAGSNIGKIFPVFMTIFLIVLLSNWQSLLPGADSVGFLEAHVDHDTGEPTDGFEVSHWFGNVYALNSKCPWVSPAATELLSENERAARQLQGCYTGTLAPAPVAEEHAEEAVVEGEAEAVVEGEATIGEEGAEAAAGAEGEEAVVEGEEHAEGEAVVEGEEHAAEGEHHYTPGDPSVPFVVLPYLRPPSTDLNMTLGMALVAVVFTQIIGFQALGIGYLGKFFNFRTLFSSPLGGIDVAVGLLELIGEIARILSFAFRLLGNVFAGSILLFVMSFLLPFLPWPFFILEFFVGAIQAIVFALLTAIFMNLATVGHHHEEHDDEEHGDAAHAEAHG